MITPHRPVSRSDGPVTLRSRLIAHMLAAQPWLESPLTLNIVTALGTLLAGVGAIWVILFAGPRYRLFYGPMTYRPEDGKWKVEIYLSTGGRRDITREAFDGDRPVELDIGVRILDLADEPLTSLTGTRVVDHRVEGTCLLIGPAVIHRQQVLRFTVATEAQPLPLICRTSLIDVRVRRAHLTPLGRFRVAYLEGALVIAVLWVVEYTILKDIGIRLQTWSAVTSLFILGVLAGALTGGQIRIPRKQGR